MSAFLAQALTGILRARLAVHTDQHDTEVPVIKIVRKFKCLVGLSDGVTVTCDGIEHEGKLWLVPEWLAHPNKPLAKPARIIRFDHFPHQAMAEDDLEYQNIRAPISESALRGEVPPGVEYEDLPRNLYVRIPKVGR
jgi:hypothetical protein